MKKSSWLKLATGAMVAVVAVGLSACGNKKSESTDSSKKSSAPVEITFWHGMNGPYQKAIDSIISDFNKSQSDYKVKGTPQGNYTALQQKIMAAAKSNSLPTIGQTTYTTVPDYKKNNLIVSLDDLVEKGSDKLSSADLKDIYPAFLESSKYDGSYYSMPFSKSARIMYVNQDILKKYNLEMPKTWEDVAKIGDTLKADGIYAMGFDKSFDMEYNALVHQAGTELVTSKGKVNVNSKKSVAAANVIMDMVNNGTAKTAGEDMYFTNMFIQGKALFYVGSSAGITQMKAQAPKTLNWSTTQTPTYEGKHATEVAGNDVVLFRGASKEQQKGAWKFMKYLTSKKVTVKWATLTNYVPVRKSSMDEADYKTYLKENPTSQAAVDALPTAFSSTAFVGFTEYRTNLLNSVDSMLTKGTPTKTALDELQTSTEKIIKDNK